MFSGNLSKPALYSLFRLLSVKRRQGLLEITLEGKTLNIILIEGLVCHVLFANGAELKYLIETLLRAGLISNHLAKIVLTQHRSLDASYSYLVDGGHLTSEQFLSAKRCYERNLLHSLRTQNQAKYSFSPKVIAANEELALRDSPGQLLLDMIEIEQDELKFRQYFCVEADPRLSRAVVVPSIKLTTNEQLIWNLIGQGTTLKNLFDKILLCHFDIKKGLLGLYFHRLLKVAGKAYEDRKPAIPAKPEVVQISADLISQEEEIIKEAAKLLKPVAETNIVSSAQELTSSGHDDEATDHVPQKTVIIEQPETKIENQLLESALDSSPKNIVKLSIRERFRSWNELFLDEETRFNIALFIMMAFLFVVALIVPKQLNSWFEILNKFSSLGL